MTMKLMNIGMNIFILPKLSERKGEMEKGRKEEEGVKTKSLRSRVLIMSIAFAWKELEQFFPNKINL